MKLHYHVQPGGNFGDDLNQWLWDNLIPGWQDWDPDVTFFGVGTLLQGNRLSEYYDKRLLIIGSGAGYGPLPSRLPLPTQWDVRCVRGPESARLLQLENKLGVLDPAALIPDIEEFLKIPTSASPIFIPHHSSVNRHNWDSLCRDVGIEFVSPRGDSKDVIKKIAGASLVIAESMHAAIIADAFRVPWVPVSISKSFYSKKWQDWASSLKVNCTIFPLFPGIDAIDSNFPIFRYRKTRLTARRNLEEIFARRALKKAVNRRPQSLSDADTLISKKETLNNIIAEVIRDYG